MIRRQVSAALLVRDGFSGKTLPDGSGTLCLLDGRPFRPLWKPDGYLVLTDLAPGEHTLTLRRDGFQEETLRLTVRGGAFRETTVALKPGARYRFPAGTALLSLYLTDASGGEPMAGAELWIGMPDVARLKLAQDKSRKQTERVRVFCTGATARQAVPGWFLVADAAAPELVFLHALHGEEAELDAPMTVPHARGKELIPAQPYRADAEGRLTVRFRREGTVSLLCSGSWKQIELKPGEQHLDWMI